MGAESSACRRWHRHGQRRWSPALALALSLAGSWLLAADAGAVGEISYDGCISNDGSSGSCADAPGTPLTGPNGVAVSPDGKSVYVVSSGSNAIVHFFVAPGGQLSYDGCISDDGSGGLCADAPGTPLTGAISVAVSPDGKSVYVASPAAGTITQFFAAPQGQLTYVGCISKDGSGGNCVAAPSVPQTIPLSVAVSPDGKSVYVASGSFSDGSVTHFFVGPTGQLSYDGCISNDGAGGMCVDAPGAPLSGAAGVAVSPDSRSVYVTSLASGTVTHFFAAPQGQLSYDGCISNDGSAGMCADAPGSPLGGADGLAVSPDGKSVYVTGSVSGTVTHFFAAPQGQLSYDGCISDDGSAGMCADAPGAPLSGAAGVAVSPDSRSVYVVSEGASTLTVFADAPQGQLTFAGCVSDAGSGGSCTDAPGTPLTGASAVAVSPNGGSVYATADRASDIVHFFRQGVTVATPSLTHLAISPVKFRAAAQGSSANGTKVSFRLNVAARVSFVVRESQPGRRVGNGNRSRCVAPAQRNRNAPHCTRIVTLGSFSVNGNAGANSLRFTGRLNGKKLPPGSYTLVATPSAGGKTGKSASVGFTIQR